MPAAAKTRRIHQPRWARELYRPHDYKVLHGGRGSGKTWGIATALVYLAAEKPLRICVGREHLKSIDESAKPVLELMAERMGLIGPGGFRVTNTSLDHANGSHIFFIGLSKVSEEDIKGLESVDIMWVEEAHRMSIDSWVLLRPTIRKEGSEVWISFNPKNRYDPVYIDFVAKSNPRAWVRKVNYSENPWFTDRMNNDRLDDLAYNPERYPHVWLGEPDDASDVQKVLPYELLRICVDAWPRRNEEAGLGMMHAGLDVADTGVDRNALVGRRGPCILHAEDWSGQASTIGKTFRRADAWCVENDVARLYYDLGGIGAGIRSHLADRGPRPYAFVGEHFGGKIFGEDVLYTKGVYNKDYFAKRNAQLGWSVRLRANMTARLIDGDAKVNPEACLFINPKIPDLEAYLAQLSQPEWTMMRARCASTSNPRMRPRPTSMMEPCYPLRRIRGADCASRAEAVYSNGRPRGPATRYPVPPWYAPETFSVGVKLGYGAGPTLPFRLCDTRGKDQPRPPYLKQYGARSMRRARLCGRRNTGTLQGSVAAAI